MRTAVLLCMLAAWLAIGVRMIATTTHDRLKKLKWSAAAERRPRARAAAMAVVAYEGFQLVAVVFDDSALWSPELRTTATVVSGAGLRPDPRIRAQTGVALFLAHLAHGLAYHAGVQPALARHPLVLVCMHQLLTLTTMRLAFDLASCASLEEMGIRCESRPAAVVQWVAGAFVLFVYANAMLHTMAREDEPRPFPMHHAFEYAWVMLKVLVCARLPPAAHWSIVMAVMLLMALGHGRLQPVVGYGARWMNCVYAGVYASGIAANAIGLLTLAEPAAVDLAVLSTLLLAWGLGFAANAALWPAGPSLERRAAGRDAHAQLVLRAIRRDPPPPTRRPPVGAWDASMVVASWDPATGRLEAEALALGDVLGVVATRRDPDMFAKLRAIHRRAPLDRSWRAWVRQELRRSPPPPPEAIELLGDTLVAAEDFRALVAMADEMVREWMPRVRRAERERLWTCIKRSLEGLGTVPPGSGPLLDHLDAGIHRGEIVPWRVLRHLAARRPEAVLAHPTLVARTRAAARRQIQALAVLAVLRRAMPLDDELACLLDERAHHGAEWQALVDKWDRPAPEGELVRIALKSAAGGPLAGTTPRESAPVPSDSP